MATRHSSSSDRLESFLFNEGMSRQAAHALEMEFDDLESVCESSDDTLSDIKYVGPQALSVIDSLRAERTPWDPRSLLSDEVEIDGMKIPSEEIEIPDDLPQSEEERRIAVAEHILSYTHVLAENHPAGPITHHEEIRKAMTKWLNRLPEDEYGSEYDRWKEGIHSLTPKERNRGIIEAHDPQTPHERLEQRSQKADAVIKWAYDVFDVVDEEVESLRDDWRETLIDEAEREVERRKAHQFRADPPDEINGYKRVTVSDEEFALAYRGWSQGKTHMVVAAYRDDAGDLQVDEFTYPAWVVNGESPRGHRENKRLCFDTLESRDEATAQLRSHLTSWTGAPDHDPSDYPREINGWLLDYVDEERLEKISYVDPDTDEELVARGSDESDSWTVMHSAPNEESIEIAAVPTLEEARDLLLECATEMMAVEGGGTIEEHRTVAASMGPEATYEPPIHIGQLYRRTWKPDEGVLTYFDLDEKCSYHLLWDGSYNLFWIQKKGVSNTVDHRDPSTIVYGEEQEGIEASTSTAAARQMGQWLQEHVASFEVPREVNGWTATSVAAGHGYQTPCGRGTAYIESHFDGYSVRTSRPGNSSRTVSPRVDDREMAAAHLLEFVGTTEPGEFLTDSRDDLPEMDQSDVSEWTSEP